MKIFKRFAADEKGAAYIMAGFAIVPLFGMTALGVDYANAVRAETLINTASQSVALHLAKRVALNPNLTSEELEAEGKELMANITDGMELRYELFEVEPESGTVRILARTDVDTYFMHLFGHETLTPVAEVQAQFGRRNVEVAIAIDNSGSMGRTSNGKRMIQAAKDATTILIDAATDSMEDMENTDLKFSIIPWHTNVSVPEEFLVDRFGDDEWWIDWEGRSTGHFRYLPPYQNNGDMYFAMPTSNGGTSRQWHHYDPMLLTDYLPLEWNGNGVDLPALRDLPGINIITRRDVFNRFTDVEWNGCFEHRHGDYRFSFDPPNDVDGDSLFVPYMAPDEWDRRSNHNSYLHDFGGDSDHASEISNLSRWPEELARMAHTPKYAVDPGPISTSRHRGSTNWFGPNGKCNTAPMLPLTDNRDDIDEAIDNMEANGNTDLTIGLSWAMNTLTPWAPLEQAGDFDKTQKIMVFMTDGDNVPVRPGEYRTSYTSLQYTKDDITDYGLPSRPSGRQATEMFDNASMEFCTAIRNRGVRVYFVYFGNPSANATRIMNHCASSPETAIAAANSDELEEAFRKIGDDIGKLRLTHYTPPDNN